MASGPRRPRGHPAGLIRSDTFATNPLIRVTGPDARLTGIRLQGPKPSPVYRAPLPFLPRRPRRATVTTTDSPRPPASRRGHPTAARRQLRNWAGWSLGAVHLVDGDGHQVQYCFIHHNQYQGLGYGVCLDEAENAGRGQTCSTPTATPLLAPGASGSGYEARNKRRDGTQPEPLLSTCTAGRDRKDGTDMAGGWMHVHHKHLPRPRPTRRGHPRPRPEDQVCDRAQLVFTTEPSAVPSAVRSASQCATTLGVGRTQCCADPSCSLKNVQFTDCLPFSGSRAPPNHKVRAATRPMPRGCQWSFRSGRPNRRYSPWPGGCPPPPRSPTKAPQPLKTPPRPSSGARSAPRVIMVSRPYAVAQTHYHQG